ncbi:inositol monophosphatase [Candidatus Dependentiae bacterium]|nr:inositol monophosphatase [Candidatus Dependentiae bacterium]
MEIAQRVIDETRAAVKQAGQLLLTFYGKKLEIHDKDQAGFATNADMASEKFLIAALEKILPRASWLAEEEGFSPGAPEKQFSHSVNDSSPAFFGDKEEGFSPGGKSGNNELCWVIDPLDGTTNFARQIPYFCVSVALTSQGHPILGIVYDPLRDELFVAQQGKPTTLNGKPVAVSRVQTLDKAMVFFGLPYTKGKAHSDTLKTADALAPKIFAYRHLGAIALEQAYVACGRADGLFFQELGWWDIAAGMLLIQEAGGTVTTYHGTVPTADYRSYLAGNTEIYRQLMLYLAQED